MDKSVWYLIVTAIAIPAVGLAFAHWAARMGRDATKFSARLQAAQRRHDVEIAHMQTCLDQLLEAATAVQSYVWYTDDDVRRAATIDSDDWDNSRDLVERSVVGAQRLRATALTLPTESLRNAYLAVESLIMEVIKGSDDPDAPDPWKNATHNQPDPIVTAITASSNELKRLFDTYPPEKG